jgi:hypothetical protein
VGFQTAFTELKETLNRKLKDLEELHRTRITESEKTRLFYKIQGLKIAVEDINRLEKDYGLCLHENAVMEGMRYYYCPNCNKKFHDYSL